MPKTVIDLFEVVEVDKQHGQPSAVAFGALYGLLEFGQQNQTVRQTRQGVQTRGQRHLVQFHRTAFGLRLRVQCRQRQELIRLQHLHALVVVQSRVRQHHVLQ